MLRKLVFGGLATLVTSVVLFGGDAFSYLRTGAGEVRAAVKQEVPLEFQIERARDLVADLVPEVRKSMHVVAQEQVEIEKLEQSIDRRQTNLAEKQNAIRTMRSDLASDQTHFVYAGANYSRHEVTRDLARRFDSFLASEETLNRDRERLAAKKRALVSHREQLESMLDARQQLDVELEQLQARLQSVRAAETVSQVAIDDSSLSQARELIAELNGELDVRERLIEEEGMLLDSEIHIPVEADEVPVDLTSRIDAHFGTADAVETAGSDLPADQS